MAPAGQLRLGPRSGTLFGVEFVDCTKKNIVSRGGGDSEGLGREDCYKGRNTTPRPTHRRLPSRHLPRRAVQRFRRRIARASARARARQHEFRGRSVAAHAGREQRDAAAVRRL